MYFLQLLGDDEEEYDLDGEVDNDLVDDIRSLRKLITKVKMLYNTLNSTRHLTNYVHE